MSDRYGGPERIRVARLVFAAASRAALVVYCFFRGGPRLVHTLWDTQFWGWRKS